MSSGSSSAAATVAVPLGKFNLRSRQYLRQCEPVKHREACETFIISKVRQFGEKCEIKNASSKTKVELCTALEARYREEEEHDKIATQKLRQQLNKAYFDMFFLNETERAGTLRKFFFGQSMAKRDKQKEDFIDLYISVYSDIDMAIMAENRFKVVDALHYFGRAVESLLVLIDLNIVIKTGGNYKSARIDLQKHLLALTNEYTHKIITLIQLLKEGAHSDKYVQYLLQNDFDINDYHNFTLYDHDVYAKVVNVHDGDTFTAILQVNNDFFKWNIRTYGYDSYEVTTKQPEKRARAQVCKQVMQQLVQGKVVIIRALPRTDKYGRLLSNIYLRASDMPKDFDMKPRYIDVIKGGEKNGKDEAISEPLVALAPASAAAAPLGQKKKLIKKAPTTAASNQLRYESIEPFKNELNEYVLADHPDWIYVNKLMINLGLGIPYYGGHKE